MCAVWDVCVYVYACVYVHIHVELTLNLRIHTYVHLLYIKESIKLFKRDKLLSSDSMTSKLHMFLFSVDVAKKLIVKNHKNYNISQNGVINRLNFSYEMYGFYLCV